MKTINYETHNKTVSEERLCHTKKILYDAATGTTVTPAAETTTTTTTAITTTMSTVTLNMYCVTESSWYLTHKKAHLYCYVQLYSNTRFPQAIHRCWRC